MSRTTGRRRVASEAELALWRAAMHGAEAIGDRPKVTASIPDPPPKAPATPSRTSPKPQAPTLDRRTDDRLRRGQLPIDARLDLHGMTQATARQALDGFIARMAAQGARTLLVITGKGVRLRLDDARELEPAIGILRREVPRWLNEAPNRALILAVREAATRHGGGGALYVLLRRQRARA